MRLCRIPALYPGCQWQFESWAGMETAQQSTLILVPRMCGERRGAGKSKIQRPFVAIPPHVWGQLCRRQRSEGQIYRSKYLSSPENSFWVGKRGKKIKAEQRFSVVCSDLASSCSYIVHLSLYPLGHVCFSPLWCVAPRQDLLWYSSSTRYKLPQRR